MALVIFGMLTGIAAIVLFVRALVKKSGWGLVSSGAIFVVGSILFIVSFFFMSVINEVEVELKEWEVNVEPATVNSARSIFTGLSFQDIDFKITNTGSMDHEFVVAETKAAPGNLPVEDGRVRYYTYIGEDEPVMCFRTGGGWAVETARGSPPEWMGPDPGVLVASGEMKSFTMSAKSGWPAGATFVVFSNQPGDYERGMYTGFIVTNPPWINIYWWVVLLVTVMVGLMVYFLAIRPRCHV